MDKPDIMKPTLIQILNNKLKFLGLNDYKVINLSHDYQTAFVVDIKGRKGAIRAELIADTQAQDQVK